MRCYLLLIVILVIVDVTRSLEHAGRIDEIVETKKAESHNANRYADNLASNSKIKLVNNLAAAQESKIKFSADAKDAHDEHVASFQANQAKVDLENTEKLNAKNNPEHKMRSTLAAHGVSDSLVEEINNMATSYIPRETIVKHVQSHFPNKGQHEWNDIVISAIGVAGKSQPHPMDNQKSMNAEVQMDKARFETAKKSLQNKQDAAE